MRERPATPAGEFHRAGSHASTRIARALPQPPPVPAESLARVHEPEAVGAQLHVSGPSRLPPELAELEQVQEAEAVGAELEPVEIPLAGRSLIPDDVLEAIAREESELLAEESFAEQEAAADAYGDESYALTDSDLEIACEAVTEQEALASLRRAELLRELPGEALLVLAQDAIRVHLEDRQPVFREGAAADSFFVVERGVLERLRVAPGVGELALGHCGPGEPFGLFGLLTRKVRTATVRPIGEAQVLELRASRLDAVARAFPAARQALARYFKNRLLENFASAGPLLPDLDAVGRAALISHFQDRKLAAGEVLLSPGEVQTHLALVTSGCIAVSRREGPGRDRQLARLARGDFLGVVSSLAGVPTRASITALEPSTLCVLPQRAFNEFVKGYPSLRALPVRLAEVGDQVERDVFVGDATALG